MTRRFELTDAEWERLAPLLPSSGGRGGQWVDHRRVVSGILYRVRTGVPWRDLPERFGPWKTCYERHRRWSADGTWRRILDELRIGADLAEGDDWTVGVDSTAVRAHQHAAGARHRRPRRLRKRGTLRRDESDGREALGRSRGGLTTKIHLAADRRCRPIARLTSPGQRFDGTMLLRVLGQVRIKRCGIGRDRVRPGRVLADKAYSSRAIRAHLRRRGIKAVIPEKTDQQKWRKRRGAAGGRPVAFDSQAYKDRNVVERCISKLKQFRAVATRYDKRAFVYDGTIDVASIKIWLRDLTQDLPDTA
ncbi:IS5 family transposase [Actinomadura meridiana]